MLLFGPSRQAGKIYLLAPMAAVTETNSYEGNILAYPNPVNSILRIKSEGINTLNESTISFYTIKGQKLLEQKIKEDITEIDVSN
jgi:hypothetical protein